MRSRSLARPEASNDLVQGVRRFVIDQTNGASASKERTATILRFPGDGLAVGNLMTVFGFKLVAPDRLGSLGTLCAASAGSALQPVPAQAYGVVASLAAARANAPGPIQKCHPQSHPRAIRDAQ